MSQKFRSTKTESSNKDSAFSDFSSFNLNNLENSKGPTEDRSSKLIKNFLVGAFIAVFGMYFITSTNISSDKLLTEQQQQELQAQRDARQLERVNDYKARISSIATYNFTDEDYQLLFENSVDDDYIIRLFTIGYTDLTAQQIVTLDEEDVSPTFISMMQDLGYDLSYEDLLRLETNNVTAYYTSNIHDLGYKDVTVDDLIRLKNIGVTPEQIKRLQSQLDHQPTLEEISRNRISNQ